MRKKGFIQLTIIFFWSLMQTGCLEQMVQATVAPQTAVVDSLSALGQRAALATSQNNSSAVTDIDRILAQYPDAANRDELLAMRNELKEQGVVNNGNAQKNAQRSDLLPLIPARAPDRMRLSSLYQTSDDGIAQPLYPMITVPTLPLNDETNNASIQFKTLRLR